MKKMFIIGAIVLGMTAGTAYALNSNFAMSSYHAPSNVLVVYKRVKPGTPKAECYKGECVAVAGKLRFPSTYSAVAAAKHIISLELTTDQIQSECSGWSGKDER